ncbi:MAG: pirin family protein [Microbacteriaceae bacterium]
MSNTEKAPEQVLCEEAHAAAPWLIEAREVPLGGPRQMLVKRTLPARGLTLIGAWCFVDHYGPTPVRNAAGMRVPGHPHTGLQTVSWLFEGEIEHRDTAGHHAFVRPGEVNIMTAGSGIAHSEFSTPATEVLHGVQLWVALPAAARFVERSFEHYVPEIFDYQSGAARVLVGEFAGQHSPVKSYTELLGVELSFHEAGTVELELNTNYEHGILVDTGTITAEGIRAASADLVYFPPGRGRLELEISEKTRVMLLGGVPFGEKLVMWWNFIARDHDEILQFRERWESERGLAADGETRSGMFGSFPSEWPSTLAAPELPNVRLKPRE